MTCDPYLLICGLVTLLSGEWYCVMKQKAMGKSKVNSVIKERKENTSVFLWLYVKLKKLDTVVLKKYWSIYDDTYVTKRSYRYVQFDLFFSKQRY